MLWAGLATSVFVAAYWLGVWGRSVRWTQTRTLLTVVSGIAALALAAVAGLIFSDFEREVGYFIGTTLAPMIWVILTILIWRETAYERSLRLEASGLGTIVCPHCGYNLTGLVEARCPECGTKYTLDDLLRRQPARAMAAEL
jgi:DNA-directed RNA polymerase subunit RPC12/RpoP